MQEIEDARVRTVRLTELGKTTYDAALPFWREAQARILASLGPERWTGMRVELDKIENICAQSG